MPLKTRTPGTELGTPASRPLSTRTVFSLGETLRGTSSKRKQQKLMILVIAFFSRNSVKRKRKRKTADKYTPNPNYDHRSEIRNEEIKPSLLYQRFGAPCRSIGRKNAVLQ